MGFRILFRTFEFFSWLSHHEFQGIWLPVFASFLQPGRDHLQGGARSVLAGSQERLQAAGVGSREER